MKRVIRPILVLALAILAGCGYPDDDLSAVPVTNNPNLLPSSQTAQSSMFGN